MAFHIRQKVRDVCFSCQFFLFFLWPIAEVLLLADLGGCNQQLRIPPSRVSDFPRSNSCFSFASDNEEDEPGETPD